MIINPFFFNHSFTISSHVVHFMHLAPVLFTLHIPDLCTVTHIVNLQCLLLIPDPFHYVCYSHLAPVPVSYPHLAPVPVCYPHLIPYFLYVAHT